MQAYNCFGRGRKRSEEGKGKLCSLEERGISVQLYCFGVGRACGYFEWWVGN